jgi:hypothetical protein
MRRGEKRTVRHGFQLLDRSVEQFHGLVEISWGHGRASTKAAANELNASLVDEVVEGLEVVKAIAAVPRITLDGVDRPLDPPVLKTLRIVDAKP